MSDLLHPLDMLKDAENAVQHAVAVGVEAAHKLAVDAHILPAAKPAEAHPTAAVPKATDGHPLTTTDKPAAHPATTGAPKATDGHALTTTDKPAAKPEAKADVKPADQSFSIQDIMGAAGSAVGSGLSGVGHFVSGVVDCLPGLHLTDNSKPAENPVHTEVAATKPNGSDKPTTTAKASTAEVTTIMAASAGAIAAGLAGGLFGAGAGAIAAAAAAKNGYVNLDLEKSFDKVEHKKENFSLEDYLKSTGCSTSDKCSVPVKSGSADLFGDGGSLNITSTANMTDHKASQQAAAMTERVSSKTWQTIDNVQKLGAQGHQDRPTETSRNSEKVADGFVHKDSNGKIDFERHGDIESRHNPDGSISTMNVRTQEKTLTDKDGNLLFTYDKNGVNGHTPDGTVLTFKHGCDEVTVKPKEGPAIKAGRDANGALTAQIEGTNIRVETRQAIAGIADAPIQIQGTYFNGTADITIMTNAKVIRAKNGHTMYVGDDGISAMTLDEHSQVVRYPDQPNSFTIFYNDGRPKLVISADQVEGKFKDPQQIAKLKFVIDSLRHYGQTGELNDNAGNRITTDSTGKTTASTVDATTTTNAAGQTIATAVASGEQLVMDTKAKTTTVVNAAGETQGVIDFKTPGKPGFTTNAYTLHNDQITTVNGDVYGPRDIQFHDGFKFCEDGTIQDQTGNRFNAEGDMTYDHERSTAKSSSESTHAAESSRAKAQVSQAESIASSIRARVASGHVSASDIAALYSQMSSLSAMVGSLSQIDDSSVLVAAMMAKDEIAGSLEVANSTLGQRHEQKAVMENLATAAQTRGPGAQTTASANAA